MEKEAVDPCMQRWEQKEHQGWLHSGIQIGTIRTQWMEVGRAGMPPTNVALKISEGVV